MKAMLSNTYEGQNPKGWLLSEKLDGVRALWTGSELITRNGNPIAAPAWFTAALPPIPLDGELWAGRGLFQRTVGIVRGKSGTGWEELKFMVFDAPAAAGGFEQRLATAAQAITGSPIAQIVAHITCAGRKHLLAHAADMIAAGAEGVMLRKPGSKYQPRRSSLMLKFKPVETEEAEVTGHTPGKASLRCRWNGIVFGLATALRPPVGSTVTFQFLGLTDTGKPRSPSFITVRDYE